MPLSSRPRRLARELAEHVSDIVVVFDREGRVRYANPAISRHRGYHPRDVVGRLPREVGIPEDACRSFEQAVARAFETGAETTFEFSFEGPLGTRVHRVVAFADEDEDGVVTGVVAIVREHPEHVARAVEQRTRYEQVLRASEERYRTLVDNLPSVLMRFGQDLRIVFLSQRAESLTGVPSDAFIGRTNREMGMPSHLCDLWDAAILDVFRTGETRDLEFELPVEGRPRAFFLRLAPEFANDGTVRHVLGISTDVTERRRTEQALRESEHLYRAIGESIDYGVWVCAPDGRNIYASDSFLKLVGMTQEQCSSFGWGDVLHPEDAERTIAAWQETVRSGATWWDIEHRFRGVDGQYHAILARGVPVRDERGEVVCWAGINLDIDRMKRTEAALLASREELREADRRKDEFLALLSHELRNPLAPIRNSFLVLREAAPGSAAARRALEVGDRQVAHLTRLVDDLLDINRIARGKIELERAPVDVVEIVRRTVADHRTLFDARGIAVAAELDPDGAWVDGDAVRLAQVVGNLLQNALKFSRPGGKVEVEAARAGERVRVTVRDDGVGIEPALLNRVFEPFAQLEAPGRGQGGLGLGLALVQRLVDLHGGDVRADSAGLGLGAAFTLTLPRIDAPAATRRVVGASHTVTSRRVLVVEDNRDAAESLQLVLELRGHVVEICHTGADALACVETFGPHTVICDIGLPDIDGHEVARRLRARGSAPLQLIALTGYGMDDDRARAAAAGFDAHLVKPADLELLDRLLEQD